MLVASPYLDKAPSHISLSLSKPVRGVKVLPDEDIIPTNAARVLVSHRKKEVVHLPPLQVLSFLILWENSWTWTFRRTWCLGRLCLHARARQGSLQLWLWLSTGTLSAPGENILPQTNRNGNVILSSYYNECQCNYRKFSSLNVQHQ